MIRIQNIEEKLNKFQCLRCHECCKKPGYVYLNQQEAEACAVFLGLNPFEFINRFCDLQDRRRLVLKRREDESCIFLSDNGCAVHDVKPKQCRDFPVKWRTEQSFEYCEGMKRVLKND